MKPCDLLKYSAVIWGRFGTNGEETGITSSAAQGTILGSDLRNTTYDKTLRIEIRVNIHIVGDGDDTITVIFARKMLSTPHIIVCFFERSRRSGVHQCYMYNLIGIEVGFPFITF